MTSHLLDSARLLLPDLIGIRRSLHRRPEVGLHLPITRQVVVDELARLGVEMHLHETTSGVVGVVGGGDADRGVLLRADMDALPMPEDTGLEFSSESGDVMHACGHDLHTAMLLGAARMLVDRVDELQRPVLLMFQPGEEGDHGARLMIEEGLLETAGVTPEHAFAIHVFSMLPSGMVASKPGPIMASADEVTITVTGRGGHASMPHFAVDPIPVAAEIILAIETAITRRISVFDPAVVTFGQMKAGTAHNVIPESALLNGTIRALSESTRSATHELVARVAHGVAAAHEVDVVVDIAMGYPVTVNDTGRYDVVSSIAESMVGADATQELPHPMMGAEDWSYVLERVPGVMAFLGACPPELDPASAPPNHSNRVVFDEEAMAVGAALYAAVALD
jgi:amidohydrolase